MSSLSQLQKRLFFKLPLDRHCTLHLCPAGDALCCLTAAGELYYAPLTGRQLKLVRPSVAEFLWLDARRCVLLDGATHELLFYLLDTQDTVKFVVLMQFSFPFVASALADHGLVLQLDDALQLLKFHTFTLPGDMGRGGESVKELFCTAKSEHLLRFHVQTSTRTLQLTSCLKLARGGVATACGDVCLFYAPLSRNLFIVSAVEREFLVVASLKKILSPRTSAKIHLIALSPDGRWLVLVTSDLDVHQVQFAALNEDSVMSKGSIFSCQTGRYLEEDYQPDIAARRPSRRMNTVWEREVAQLVAKNHAKEHYTTTGWIFPPMDAAAPVNMPWRAPEEFEGFVPQALHCTPTETYVLAKNFEHILLLGVKKLTGPEGVWMSFSQECAIAFPTDQPYPILLFYPMSVAVIAPDQATGFLPEVARAAAPDPWEDLSENQVMELAFMQDIIDKAVDYLLKRYPQRTGLLETDYPTKAAISIAREYLEARNPSGAQDILNFVNLDVNQQMRDLLYATSSPDLRQWLFDDLRSRTVVGETDTVLYEYILQMEAHLPQPLSMESVKDWTDLQRRQKLLEVAITTRDIALVDTFPADFLFDLLLSLDDTVRLTSWIHSRPDFTTHLIDPAFRERIPDDSALADEFARQGIFSASELTHWRDYIRRLMSAFDQHPFFDKTNPQRLLELPPPIREAFITFCVEQKLVAVVGELADEQGFREWVGAREGELPEWLTVYLLFRRTEMEDVGQVKELAEANARLCYGKEATLERLIEMEETELAVGLLFLTKDVGPWTTEPGCPSLSTASLELLQKQLSKYPKLKSALFPIRLSPEERLAKSVTVYQLLESQAPFDPRKLFGWQSTNAVNTHYRSVEVPSFSQADLQEKFGYKKDLDFTYYLKNCRASFAYWSFVSQLTSDNFKEEMQAGRDMAFFLSVFCFTDDKIVATCVAFMEMLGIESMSTRITVQSARLIKNYYQAVNNLADANAEAFTRDTFIELYKYGTEMAAGVLDDLLPATHHHLRQAGIAPATWAAVPSWTLVNQFCELYSLSLSVEYLRLCAAVNDWLGFLVFAELFQYPLAMVAPLVEGFTQTHLRENMRLILAGMKSARPEQQLHQGGLRNVRGALYARIGVVPSDKTTSGTSTSDEDLRAADSGAAKSGGDNRPANLIEVMALVQKALHPWRELLAFAVEFHAPVYAVMAANEAGVNRLLCLCILLMTSFSEAELIKAKEALNITGSLLDFHWTREHTVLLTNQHAAAQNLRLASNACRAAYPASVLAHLLDVAADMEERADRPALGRKLQKVPAVAARKTSPAGRREDDVEDAEWGVATGLGVVARLVEQIKYENEWEWRRVLGLLRDSGVMKMADEGAGTGEEVQRLAAEVAGLSQALQTDASKILELKSLLRDFQRSALWSAESFRMEIWRGIFARLPVELVEKQSLMEIQEILEKALLASDSQEEKCVLLTIMWKLDDTPQRLRAAWEAKVTFGLSTSRPLEEWIRDGLLGAGAPPADLQTELLSLARLCLRDIPQLINTGNSRDAMLDAMTAYLLKLGNLVLAARICTEFAFLNRDLDAICAAIELAQGSKTPADLPGWIQAEVQSGTRRVSTTTLHNGLEEDAVVVWLRHIAAVCTLGKDVVQALLDHYLLTKLLSAGFEELLRANTTAVLERVFVEPSVEKVALARRCLISFRANPLEVTAFIADYVRRRLLHGLEAPEVADNPEAVRKLGESVKPFLSVAMDCVALGNHLMDTATTLQMATPQLAVELLIAAHEVLNGAGTLEGIARLMKACKGLAKLLAEKKQMASLLRLLNGIGRYSEMTFVFHLIKEADEMEKLFGRGVDKDPKLRNAILNYLRKYHPEDHNDFDMLAAHYSMHREIGETFQMIAEDKLMVFKHRAIVDTAETQSELKKIIQLMMDAAGNFARAECYFRQERCIEQARLVALQIVFLPTGLRLLSLKNPAGFVSQHPRFAEAFIYAQAYGVSKEWADGIYQNYVIQGDVRYLQDFSIKFPVTIGLVSDIAAKYKADPAKPPTAAIYMKKLLRQLSDVATAYELANELALNDLSMEILQIDDGAYLRDVMRV
ncbi:spatacsin-like [Paramacrobiotus metropolitanus]|uniref:spatacsin-like n=1 Tax=Paramacrobiotus metropolitanus TaxID=2943436 RepID=UPI002445F018|nr:spatacsin-like [Paramacrobiotus metropolitanus]